LVPMQEWHVMSVTGMVFDEDANADRDAPGFAASRGEGDGSRLLRTLQGGRIRA
jgi:hypothetical protein